MEESKGNPLTFRVVLARGIPLFSCRGGPGGMIGSFCRSSQKGYY